jgi:hypothetical protein
VAISGLAAGVVTSSQGSNLLTPLSLVAHQRTAEYREEKFDDSQDCKVIPYTTVRVLPDRNPAGERVLNCTN